MPDSLTDRQFETHRRVQPGRTVRNRKDVGFHSEEYATAVVNPDGTELPRSMEDLMLQLIYEVRALRQAMVLAGTAEEVSIGEVA